MLYMYFLINQSFSVRIIIIHTTLHYKVIQSYMDFRVRVTLNLNKKNILLNQQYFIKCFLNLPIRESPEGKHSY